MGWKIVQGTKGLSQYRGVGLAFALSPAQNTQASKSFRMQFKEWGGSWQRMGGSWAKSEGVWAKNGPWGSGQRVNGVGRALHVVGRQLQCVRRRRGAVEDVARLAGAGGGGGRRG